MFVHSAAARSRIWFFSRFCLTCWSRSSALLDPEGASSTTLPYSLVRSLMSRSVELYSDSSASISEDRAVHSGVEGFSRSISYSASSSSRYLAAALKTIYAQSDREHPPGHGPLIQLTMNILFASDIHDV